MKLIEDYKKYFESFSVCSPLNFSFTNPRDLLNKLTAFSGIPHFINRVDVLPKLKEGNKVPKNFCGWLVSYGINEKMISHFSKIGFVHVHIYGKEYDYTSFTFFKQFVLVSGCSPFNPLAEFNPYLHHETNSLNEAINLSMFEINKRRKRLKNLLALFNSSEAYYLKNEALFKIVTDPILTQEEQMKLIKKDFKITSFTFKSLKQTDKFTEEKIIFFDKLLV